ncbi:protein kinase-like domain, concanavalin A-like lectin/glucanase domain protein [Tanacetum coccineum]
MENANPFFKTLNCEPSCLKGEPKAVMLFRKDDLEEEIEEEFEEEEEEDGIEYFNTFPTREELEYHEYLLKNPRPSWIRAKIMNKGLESRKKSSNPNKICNFVGRVRGIKVFVDNFTYECDFMILEDVSSVIDYYLGGMILGKPFVKVYKLIYDKEEGTIMFEKNDEKLTLKMPHKMERFKDIEDLNTNNILSFFMKSKGDEEKGEG